jgi:hypothetical protein
MPNILSDAEMDSLRGLVRDLTMPGTAMLLSGTSTPNGMGGFSQSYGTASYGGTTEIPCRYRISSDAERLQAGVLTGVSSWTVTIPAEWPVSLADKIVLLPMNRVLSVQGVIAPNSWELQRRLTCTENR